jgi:3-oxoacyl-[acyl-carrier-protein] synthase II
MTESRDVFITASGVLSPYGIGVPSGPVEPRALSRCGDIAEFGQEGEYLFLSLDAPDYEGLIPKRADRKLMDTQFLYGCYAAGLALQEAGLLSDAERLRTTALYVASDSPDRDAAIDAKIVAAANAEGELEGAQINRIFMSELRPTAFLARIPNLLAGNISIVYGITGTSRTFCGCELGGAVTLSRAFRAVRDGLCERVLVGAALNGSRLELLRWLYAGGFGRNADETDVWSGTAGACLGSAGAFLVLEAKQSAYERGADTVVRMTQAAEQSSVESDHRHVLAGLAARMTAPSSNRPGLVVTNTGGAGLSAIETDVWKPYADAGVPVVSSASVFGSCLEADVFLETALAAAVMRGSRVLDSAHALLGGGSGVQSAAPADALVVCTGMTGGAGAFVLERP